MNEIEMHAPVIVTDGGPWATHDQACAVCHQRKAVIDVATGVFQPCWGCQERGYRLVWKRRWFRPTWKNRPPAWAPPPGSSPHDLESR